MKKPDTLDPGWWWVAAPRKRALVSAFGGKATLAPRIVAELGPHRAYWEPFGGGCSVILAKPACGMETFIDLHGDMTNLCRVVQDDELAPRLFERVGRTAFSQDLFERAAEAVKARANAPAPAEPDLGRAYDWLICSSLGRHGVQLTESYNQGFCKRYTVSGGSGASRFAAAWRSIPRWWRRLRNVAVLNTDSFDEIPKIKDEPRTVIYADPPYVEKGAEYVYDFTPEDHARLAERLGRFRAARVVVSYYEHDLLRALYDGWTFVPAAQTKALVSQARRDAGNGAVAPEVLIVNGPAYTRSAGKGWELTDEGRAAWSTSAWRPEAKP